jgi:hypothetical protein
MFEILPQAYNLLSYLFFGRRAYTGMKPILLRDRQLGEVKIFVIEDIPTIEMDVHRENRHQLISGKGWGGKLGGAVGEYTNSAHRFIREKR